MDLRRWHALASIEKIGSRRSGSTHQTGIGLDSDAVHAQVERLLAHPLFHASKRYTNLLRYIVDRTLEGQHDELKERIIGIEVFGRVPDYDTSLDATVRVAATEVRKRLLLYYNESDHAQELRIEMPVGSYVAELRLPEQKQLPIENIPHDVQSVPSRRKLQYLYFVAPLAVVVLALAGWGAWRLLAPVSAIEKFWAPILDSRGPVLICITSSKVENVSSAATSNSDSSAEPKIPYNAYSKQRVNVAMTDVSAADGVATYLRQEKKESVVRPTYGLSLSDLRSAPVIFIGLHNEWANRLGADLRYKVVKQSEPGLRWIEDESNPVNARWTVDMSAPFEKVDSDYALISRVLDPSTGQWWISIAGLTGMGTQVGRQVVTDQKAMAAICASFPTNWEHKNLQFVLAIKVIQGTPGTSRVVASYSW